MQTLFKGLLGLTVAAGAAFLALLLVLITWPMSPALAAPMQDLTVFTLGLTMLLLLITATLSAFTRDQHRARLPRPQQWTADDDERLEAILNKLPPADRDYLRERLALREMGIGSDGEMVALDDLLAEDDPPAQQQRKQR